MTFGFETLEEAYSALRIGVYLSAREIVEGGMLFPSPERAERILDELEETETNVSHSFRLMTGDIRAAVDYPVYEKVFCLTDRPRRQKPLSGGG